MFLFFILIHYNNYNYVAGLKLKYNIRKYKNLLKITFNLIVKR